MSKFPKSYTEANPGTPRDVFRPEFKFDSLGRLIMPLPGYSKYKLEVEPGSKNISQGTESESGSPATNPASLKTGYLYADTVIKCGPEGGWIIQLAGGDADRPIQYGNETTKVVNFYVDKSGNVYLSGTISAISGTIGGWTISAAALYFDGSTNAVSSGMASGDYPFYAGKKYVDRATAPYRVTSAGVIYATGAIIDGTSTIGGRVVSTIASAIDASGHFIDTALNTSAKTILGDFTFGVSGAIQIGTYVNGVSGDIRISPNGIIGRNSAGTNTFTLDATTGTITALIANVGTLTGLTIIGGTIQTDTGTSHRIVISGAANTVNFYNSSNLNTIVLDGAGTVGTYNQISIAGSIWVSGGTTATYSYGGKLGAFGFGGNSITLIIDAIGNGESGTIQVRSDGTFWFGIDPTYPITFSTTGGVGGIVCHTLNAQTSITLNGVTRTSWPSTTLSALTIDVSKNWAGYNITNLGTVSCSLLNIGGSSAYNYIAADLYLHNLQLLSGYGYIYYAGTLILNFATTKLACSVPFGFQVRSGTPGAASSFQGYMYYDTAQVDLVFSNGTNWYKVTASQI